MIDKSFHEKAYDIFEKACDMPRGERNMFVDEACGGDRALRSEVISLLEHDESPVNLNAAVLGPARDLLSTNHEGGTGAPSMYIPTRLGSYRILQKLGEGGMGEVFEAEQESPKRRVALKVIRAGLLSPKVIRRFEQEAFVLGQLQHPGIACIYESGMFDVDNGRQPFFAMELVQGQRINTYANDRHFSIRQRLELVARICDAVHHAHQKGIIHRDLKPANILVVEHTAGSSFGDGNARSGTTIDEIGQPKILDFGVARMTEGDVQATMQTEVGQLVGTLAYMSPEQVVGDSRHLDIRCDVYALGVVLFQMLTQQLPLDVSGRTMAEAARIIRDEDSVLAGSIDRALRGDIDTIIAKALEKNPDQRYTSAAELAADIRRYLGDEPIVARPASAMYQVRKFARRNRGLVGGLAATFAVLVIGLISTGYFLLEATKQRDEAIAAREEADVERDRTNDVARFFGGLINSLKSNEFGKDLMDALQNELQNAWAEADRDNPELVQEASLVSQTLERVNSTNIARELLSKTLADEALDRIDKRLTDDPLSEARLRHGVAGMYRNLGVLDAAAEQYRLSFELRREHLGPNHALTFSSMSGLARMHQRMGHYVHAEELYRELLDRRKRRYGDDHIKVLTTMGNLASLLIAAGNLEEAEHLLRAAFNGSERTLGRDHVKTLSRRNTYGALLLRLRKIDEAVACFQQLLESRERVSGPDNKKTIMVRNNLMGALFKAHRFKEAEPIAYDVLESCKRVHGDDHPETILAQNNLGVLLLSLGRASEAEALFREAYDTGQVNLNPEHEYRMKSSSNLIDAWLELGQPAEAEVLCHELLTVRRNLKPQQPGLVAQTLEQLGHAHYQQKHFASARDAWEECFKLRTGISSDHWLTNRARSELGQALTALKQYAVAERLLLNSYAALLAQSETIPIVAGADCVKDARARLVQLYEAWDKKEEAAKWRTQTKLSRAR